VVVLVALQDAAVGQHDLRPGKVIGRHAVGPAEDPEPAAQRQTRDPHGRARPRPDREATSLKRVIHGAETGAGTHPRHTPRDRHRPDARHIDHDTAGRGVPREAVPSAAHRALDAVPGEEQDRLGDILGAGAQHDRLGLQFVVPGVERLG
jgi:hypothetical protein